MSGPATTTGKRSRAPEGPSSRAPGPRKRQKGQDARVISTQGADAALSDQGQLNIASFVKAREFEINALDKSVRKARQGLMSRAFQQVPRHLRRRTASHNVKKVPRRLRMRAEREMKEDNTPTVTHRTRTPSSKLRLRLENAKALKTLNSARKTARQRKKDAKTNAAESNPSDHKSIVRAPRIKKNKLAQIPTATTKFKRRQKEKTWLPTHLWHTKRAHMTRSIEPLWRMAIPLSPSEKSYRPSHRAAGSRGCVAWDVSYVSTIACLGTEAAIDGLLKSVGFGGEGWAGIRYRKWKAGTRFASSWVFERDNPSQVIAPVDVVWNVQTPLPSDQSGVQAADDPSKAAHEKVKLDRRIMIRIHPSAFHQFWKEIVKVAKLQKPQVLVEDLRFELGSIDITGPGSTEALVGTLIPWKPESTVGSIWTNLAGLSNPASLPANTMLAFDISDCRLHHPSKQVRFVDNESSRLALSDLMVNWLPDKNFLPSSLFSHKHRHVASQLPSQKLINRRKSAMLPGQTVTLTVKDHPIPVVLLARRLNCSPSAAQGTWTVLAPWKCIDTIWRTLMYYPLSSGGTPRFGGLQEQQQVAFEHTVPWFPGDYPATEAGKAWERTQSQNRFDEWINKPPSRRLAYQTVDLGLGRRGEVGRGWVCDWEHLLQDTPNPERVDTQIESSSFQDPLQANLPLLTQRQRKAARKKAEAESKGDTNRHNTSSPEDAEESESDRSGFVATPVYSQLLPSMATSLLLGWSGSVLPSQAVLVTVKIKLLTRGTPAPTARVYRIPQASSTQQSNTAPSVNVTTDDSMHSSINKISSTAQGAPKSTSIKPAVNFSSRSLDLRSRWLALDPQTSRSSNSQSTRSEGDKTNHHSLPRKASHLPLPSLRHINVLPKNAPKEVVEQFGWKPATEEERQEELDALSNIQKEEEKVWDTHVPCPNADDLIGFVTSGGYNLAYGQGTAVASLWANRLVDGWKQETQAKNVEHKIKVGDHTQKSSKAVKQIDRERRLCIVRNAGESVGRLGLWEVCN